jgi:hypothetical protein
MKFLCLACDEPMKLTEAVPPDESGSLAATFRCPSCGAGVAMLTNAHETDVVQSLGVRIGPAGKGGGCPFTGVVREAQAAREGGLAWTAGALARLDRIPEMVRPMARLGIEQFARSAGHELVDESVLEQARAGMGM